MKDNQLKSSRITKKKHQQKGNNTISESTNFQNLGHSQKSSLRIFAKTKIWQSAIHISRPFFQTVITVETALFCQSPVLTCYMDRTQLENAYIFRISISRRTEWVTTSRSSFNIHHFSQKQGHFYLRIALLSRNSARGPQNPKTAYIFRISSSRRTEWAPTSQFFLY